jgi:hypothetical protein
MAERPRLLVLDLLESYARELDIDVRLERRHELNLWFCVLSRNGQERLARGTGATAREAIRHALEQAGVDELPYDAAASASDGEAVNARADVR